MIKNDPVYKQLLLRRDILQLIFEMRCYFALNSVQKDNPENNYIDCRQLYEMARPCHRWEKELNRIIEEAKKGNVNLTATSIFQDNLHEKIKELCANATEEERVEIHGIIGDMADLESCCPQLKTLPVELMQLAHIDYPFQERHFAKRYDKQIEALLSLTPYRPYSDETIFLITISDNFDWLKAYTKDLDAIEAERIIQDLIRVHLYSHCSRRDMLDSAFKQYKDLGVVITLATAKELLICKNEYTRLCSAVVLDLAAKHGIQIVICINELIDSLLLSAYFQVEQVQNPQQRSIEKARYLIDNIIPFFKRFPNLIESFCSELTKKLASDTDGAYILAVIYYRLRVVFPDIEIEKLLNTNSTQQELADKGFKKC